MDVRVRREQLEADIRKATGEIERLRVLVLRMQGAAAVLDEMIADGSAGDGAG